MTESLVDGPEIIGPPDVTGLSFDELRTSQAPAVLRGVARVLEAGAPGHNVGQCSQPNFGDDLSGGGGAPRQELADVHLPAVES